MDEKLEPTFNITQAVADFAYATKELPNLTREDILQLLTIAYDMFEEDELLIDPEMMGL